LLTKERATIILALIALAHTVEAQDLPPAESALGLAVARVCANEASLQRATPADCALIYQAARRHGDTQEEQLRWLTNHSSCVLGPRRRHRLRGNCAWSRNLTREGTRPQSWPTVSPWRRYKPRWLAMLAYCDALAGGAIPAGGWPCERDPDTWGGHMDHGRARRLGYTRVTCHRTANTGWMYPAWNRD